MQHVEEWVLEQQQQQNAPLKRTQNHCVQKTTLTLKMVSLEDG